MKDNKDYLFPNEPTRFEPRHIDALLIHANQMKASDITIQTGEPVFAEIYGKLYKLTHRKLTNSEVGNLLNAIYGANGTTQIQRGDDLDTHYEIRPNRNERYRHRVNGVGCYVDGQEGIQITVRTIPTIPPSLSSLNLETDIVDALAPHDGVVYVTGATGSGKSTLLAAIIKELTEQPDANRKVLTYESPIEFVYDSIETPTSIISQSEIPKHLPSFAAGVRNALRRKPRLILVGEARDSETISAVIEAALTGHPVYTTLHSNGVAETVRRLVGAFPKEERTARTIDIIETMRLIVSQRLVPSTDGKRVALREYLVFNEYIRDKILECDPNNITAITRQFVQEYGVPMSVDVHKKFDEGLISERTKKVLLARCRHEDSQN
jgi:defect in organelle trafficking protein DotB